MKRELIYLLLTFFITLMLHDCYSEELSNGAYKALLDTATDSNRPLEERVDALYQLGQLNLSNSEKHKCAESLLQLLPGKWDILTKRIIIVLGQLRERSALPRLKEISKISEHLHMEGQMNAALDSAIERIEKEIVSKTPDPPSKP